MTKLNAIIREGYVMKQAFYEITLTELDDVVRQAALDAVVDSLARGLPVCGTENGIVTTRYPGDPAFEHLAPAIASRKKALANTRQG